MPLPIPNPSQNQKEGTEEFYDSCKNTDKNLCHRLQTTKYSLGEEQ